MKLDLVAHAAQTASGHLAKLHGNHRIVAAMADENRQALIGFVCVVFQPVVEQQVSRQGHQPRQPLREAQGQLHRDRPTLRKAGHDDPPGRDSARDLAPDQRRGLIDAVRDTSLVVISVGGQAHDVIPSAHGHAAVDGHRTHRCVRKHITNGRPAGPGQFRHQRFEIVPVGAQAMQPDDRCRRLRAGVHFDGFEFDRPALATRGCSG